MKTDIQFHQLSWPRSDLLWETPTQRLQNRLLRKFGIPLRACHHFNGRRDMLSLEQAGNLQVLLTGVLDHEVPGAVVELGCHFGASTSVLAQVLQGSDRQGQLHVYDLFDDSWSVEKNARQHLEANMTRLHLPLPHVHAGDIRKTLPAELPERIAFAHIDLGMGGDAALLQQVITHALMHVYPRLSRHGILVIMDHHLPDQKSGQNTNPGVTVACNNFFANKPEQVRMLHGGPCSHAYIRKK